MATEFKVGDVVVLTYPDPSLPAYVESSGYNYERFVETPSFTITNINRYGSLTFREFPNCQAVMAVQFRLLNRVKEVSTPLKPVKGKEIFGV